MRFAPILARTTVSRIPPAHVFAVSVTGVANLGTGNYGLYFRVKDSAAARQLTTHLKLGPDVLAVQLAPFSTATNWSVSIPEELATSDVTDAVRLVYDPLPENLQLVTPEVEATLRPGDLVVDGEGTKLVVLPQNPAIGIALIDLASGDIRLGIGNDALRVLSWRLEGVTA
jgi:hypothetical protein